MKTFKVGDIVYSLISNDTNVLYEVIEITETSGTTKYNILLVKSVRRISQHSSLDKQFKRKVHLNVLPENIEKSTASKALKAKLIIFFDENL